MRERRRGFMVCALALLAGAPGWAQTNANPLLAVIDAGPAVPASAYLGRLFAGAEQPGGLADVSFPIRSILAPGRLLGPLPVLEARWMTQPIFLLGADDASLDWLKRNLRALHQQDAVGLVVSAESADAFRRVQRVAQGIAVAPGPDRWLEQILIAKGVTVLPVLIQLDGVAVQWLPLESESESGELPHE